MKKSFYFPDQYVFDTDLNNTESTRESAIKQRLLALVAPHGGTGSVVGQPGSTALQCLAIDATEIRVLAGAAVAWDGEWIEVPSPYEIIGVGSTSSTHCWTGSSVAGTARVKVEYRELPRTYKSDDYGVPYPTRYDDSYFVWIDVNTPPTATQILLAEFTCNTDGSVAGADPATAIVDRRQFIRTKGYDDQVYLQASPVGSWHVVKDHVLAHGTGVQSDGNAHGMTLADLGYTGTGSIPMTVNKGRVWAGGSDLITFPVDHTTVNFRMQVTLVQDQDTTKITRIAPARPPVIGISTITTNTAKVRVNGGYGYVEGGFGPSGDAHGNNDVVQRYDEVDNVQTTMTPLQQGRIGHAGLSLNGYGFVAFGKVLGTGYDINTDRYDPLLNTHIFRLASGWGNARWFTGGYAMNGYGFYAGGRRDDVIYSDHSRYDDTGTVFVARTALGTARWAMAAYSVNDYGFIVAGYTNATSTTVTGVNERFDDATNSYATRIALTSGRGGTTGYSMNGYGFTSGGDSGGSIFIGNTDRHDDIANTWTARVPITARSALGGYAMNDFGYTSGGATGSTTYTDIVQRYDDITGSVVSRDGFWPARCNLGAFATNEYFIEYATWNE